MSNRNNFRAFYWRFILSIFIVVACAGCESSHTASILNSQQTPQQVQLAWTDWEKSVQKKKVSVDLFPTATMVKAYGGDLNLIIDSSGSVTTQTVRWVHDPQHGWQDYFLPVPAEGGEPLSKSEMTTLRQSVYFAPPPPAEAGCCIPRHGFLFFDSSGRYLGYLKVCFQCGCAQIRPTPSSPSGMDFLVWNRDALKKILEAHHLHVRLSPS